MLPKRLVYVCIVLFLTTLAMTGTIVGASGAGITISLKGQAVMLKMTLDLEENYTALPNVSIILDSSNSTPILGLMQVAIQERLPTARIESLEAGIGTRLLDNSTKIWVFEENYTLGLAGSSTNLGGQVAFNLAFLSMDISSPINLQGVEINNIGAAYLVQPLLSLPTTSTTRWLVNGATFLNTVIPGNTTQQFNLLDFSWVPSLASWNHSYSVEGESTWNLTPSSPFNVTVGLRTVENILFPIYFAAYTPTLKLTAPARAWLENGMIFYDVPSIIDIVMPGIVVASLVTLVASFILDQRLTATFRAKRKRR